MALREIVIELGVDVDQTDLKKATGFLDSLKSAALKVGAVLATGALAAGYNRLIQLGSEAAEAQNKFEAVFTDSTERVQAALDETSRRTGIASNQLQQFASNIGAIVRPALGSSRAAGEVGATMAELALDIASFNDATPEETLVALRSGLIGSAEPLQRFGVDVRVAALEQEALRMGIQGSIKDLTEAQRIQIRQSAILRQLGEQGALGDATRTAQGFANATRGLTSQLKQLGQTIGQFLLKDAALTAVRFRDVVAQINAWFVANREIIQQRVDDVLQVINNVLEGIVMVVRSMIDGFNMLSEVLGNTATQLLLVLALITALVLILGAPVVLLLAISAAIALVIDDLVVFAKGGESVFGRLVEAAQEFLDQFIDMERVKEFADTFVKLVGSIWDRVTEIWQESLQPFFDDLIESAKEFIDIGAEATGDLFTELSTKIGKFLRQLLGSTVGRVIIDFLGAKAGAVIGEFIGRLTGVLAGRLVGKGELGQKISMFLGEELGATVGKLSGAVIGGVLADRAVLSARERLALGAPGGAPTIGPPAGGGTAVSQVNQPTTTFNMEIDASGQNEPEAIGQAVATAVRAENERRDRQTLQAFNVALEGP